MAVVVGVVAEGHVVFVLERDELRHRPRRRAVHAHLAVVVERHEGEGRVDGLVDDLDVEAVLLGYRLPEVNAGAAERVRAYLEARGRYRLHLYNLAEARDVALHVVDEADVRRFDGALERYALDLLQAVREDFVGAVLYPLRHVSPGGAAARRVVLEAAVAGRIVRRRDDDAVRRRAVLRGVPRQYRVRNDGRRRVGEALLHAQLDAVRGEDLRRGAQRRFGERVRVHAHEERPRDALACAVLAYRLRYRGYVILVEAALQRRAAVAGRAEGDALVLLPGVWMLGVVGRHKPWNVDLRTFFHLMSPCLFYMFPCCVYDSSIFRFVRFYAACHAKRYKAVTLFAIVKSFTILLNSGKQLSFIFLAEKGGKL